MNIVGIDVTLINHMGSDLTVVNAARVSFAKHRIKFSDDDKRLVRYLAEHNHWTPFAHCFAQFRVKAPIFVARQLGKHQVGLVWNEISRRYVDSEPEFWFPDEWRTRPEGSVKQGSGGRHPSSDTWDATAKTNVRILVGVYNAMIRDGIAPEQARMILPQNMMTEWYWSGSLAAFARVCKQRMDPHAQEETKQVARKMSEQLAKVFPVSWQELMKQRGGNHERTKDDRNLSDEV